MEAIDLHDVARGKTDIVLRYLADQQPDVAGECAFEEEVGCKARRKTWPPLMCAGTFLPYRGAGEKNTKPLFVPCEGHGSTTNTKMQCNVT